MKNMSFIIFQHFHSRTKILRMESTWQFGPKNGNYTNKVEIMRTKGGKWIYKITKQQALYFELVVYIFSRFLTVYTAVKLKHFNREVPLIIIER